MRAGQRIRKEVESWPGIELKPHRFGGVEFVYGRVELGHLHGDDLADLPFPKKTRDELIEAGRARPQQARDRPDRASLPRFHIASGKKERPAPFIIEQWIHLAIRGTTPGPFS